MKDRISRTSRVLSVYHLFLHCEEVSFEELFGAFGVSRRTSFRDIQLLRQAGVLRVRFDRTRGAFLPVSFGLSPIERQSNQTRQKYLEKLRRLCILLRGMAEEDTDNGTDRTELYRRLLPGIPDRTRQRDFKELEKLGYCAYYDPGWEDEPGHWCYELPGTYALNTYQPGY